MQQRQKVIPTASTTGLVRRLTFKIRNKVNHLRDLAKGILHSRKKMMIGGAALGLMVGATLVANQNGYFKKTAAGITNAVNKTTAGITGLVSSGEACRKGYVAKFVPNKRDPNKGHYERVRDGNTRKWKRC